MFAGTIGSCCRLEITPNKEMISSWSIEDLQRWDQTSEFIPNISESRHDVY
jgi:hypothetical protein